MRVSCRATHERPPWASARTILRWLAAHRRTHYTLSTPARSAAGSLSLAPRTVPKPGHPNPAAHGDHRVSTLLCGPEFTPGHSALFLPKQGHRNLQDLISLPQLTELDTQLSALGTLGGVLLVRSFTGDLTHDPHPELGRAPISRHEPTQSQKGENPQLRNATHSTPKKRDSRPPFFYRQTC